MIPFPGKAGKLSAACQEAWGQLEADSSMPPHCSPELPEPPTPGEPVTAAEGWGSGPLIHRGTGAENGQVARAAEGGAEQVPKFKQPLGSVRSLHSTGFYTNSQGTNPFD